MMAAAVSSRDQVFTAPDLPAGDDSFEALPEPLPGSLDCSSDDEGCPRRPYATISKAISKTSPHKRTKALYIRPFPSVKPASPTSASAYASPDQSCFSVHINLKESGSEAKEESKDMTSITKATDSSGGSGTAPHKHVDLEPVRRASYKMVHRSALGPLFGRRPPRAPDVDPTKAGRKWIKNVRLDLTDYMKKRPKQSRDQQRNEVVLELEESINEESQQVSTLHQYWVRKEAIDGKYEKLMLQLDREQNVEINLKVSHTAGNSSQQATKVVEDLGKIKDYYEGVKSLICKQKLFEEEELLRDYEIKLGPLKNN